MTVRILIIDDSQLIRKLLREYLQTHTGWEVCGEAENGQQALELAEKLKPNLIVLDLSMPVMNGLQAAPMLRKSLPSSPIVMFTSYKTDHLHELALAAGVTAVVQKPNLAVLVSSIQSLFPDQSSELRTFTA
jgi:CheY-like chemotaxis protein